MIDVEQAYRQFGPLVLRRCRRLLRDEGRAMDAMQDVFVEVLRRHDTLDASAPAGLFMRVATNVCLNRLRTVRRRKEDPTDGLLMDIAAVVPDREEQSTARRMLTRIFGGRTDSTFEIAVLHYVDRMTLEEVAQEVGLSVSGVRKRLRTLRERLPVEEGAAS
ncbi:MAG TPA: sigma-70 family RNA polymerase sigma factor [Polyangia bacterium]|jgi:RNA polymerase sigma-70 factor (ECF subfamily)|nr:sigma-70 family RNA polymerase sigma factor [Polyangia bacterium]